MRKNINLQKMAILLIYVLTLSVSLAFHAWAANSMDSTDKPPEHSVAEEGTVALLRDAEEAEDFLPEEKTENHLLPEAANAGQPEWAEPQRDLRLADRKTANRVPPKTSVETPVVPKQPKPTVKPVEKPAKPALPPPIQPEPKPEPETPVTPAPPAEPPAPDPSSDDTELNPYVLDVIRTYTNGPYPYLLLNGDYDKYNGVTENIWFGGKILARAHPSGIKYSHCVGITFEVFFKAMQARNRKLGISPDNFNGMTFNEMHNFLLLWYAAGPKTSNNLAVAVEKYGIGKRITRFEDAKRGDFMDYSRTNGTGHAVVFLNWVRDGNDTIIGFDYWSSQGSGIGERREYFASSGRGKVMTSPVFIARIYPVSEYKRFR